MDSAVLENDLAEKLAGITKREGSVVILTGAGVSAESGVPTFRGKDGLWADHRVEELATPQAFARDPELVWRWYDWRRGIIAGCEPNPAHHAIAKMEKLVKHFLLITQNVDGLHGRAGNVRVLELHGNIWRMRCTKEGSVGENYGVPLSSVPPLCERCHAVLRPDVVWFGESLESEILQCAWTAAEDCELMLVVGTSAVVHPAASLPRVAKNNNALIIEVNTEPTPVSRIADYSIFGEAGEILPKILEGMGHSKL